MELNSEALEQGRKIFQEEATEKLSELEEALMTLEESPGESEPIDQAFRALHTIKGSGSMFGFDRVSGFAHQVETVFDQVRDGDIAVSPELIQASLLAHDLIRDLLSADQGGSPVDPARVEELLGRFSAISGAAGEPDAPAAPRVTETEPGETHELRRYAIRFEPDRKIMANGTKIAPLLREMMSLGSGQLEAQTDSLPLLEAMQPEDCYLWWKTELQADCDANEIRDVFIFVEDDCKLDLEELGPVIEAETPQATQPSSPLSDEAAQPTTAQKAPPSPAQPAPQAVPQPPQTAPSHKLEAAANIKVGSEKLDQLVDLVGELVTAQARLTELAAREADPEMLTLSEEIERLTGELRDTAMNMRMVAIGSTFNRFKRLVRDLSAKLDQKAQLTTEGGETELDKSMIDRLADPLVHIIRNSLDHGIEPPEQREREGKPAVGQVHLSARHAAGSVLISIRDDGRGLDAEKLRKKAESRGLIPPGSELTPRELYGLIFHPGFSTKEQVTNLSGRGVGMDVVKRSVEALRGAVEIDSQPGKGTEITLRLPLTLAIIDGLLVRLDGAPYVLPLSSIEECVELSRNEIEASRGRNVAMVRGEIVPYVHLRQALKLHHDLPPIQHAVVAEVEGRRIGFVVDEVIGGHQTVIKSLGRYFDHLKNVSGATVLGDGSVALILDLNRLVQGAELSAAGRNLEGEA